MSTIQKFPNVYELSHPLAKHYLTHLRDINTKPPLFRTLTKKLSLILALEASSDIMTKNIEISTPLENINAEIIDDEIVIIPILRSGLGMIEPITELFPNVKIGYVGIQRDEKTALPTEYYAKIPKLKDCIVFVVDPMLASGGSASHALAYVKAQKPKKVILLSIVSAPEGIELIIKNHPDVLIYTASVDRELNEKKYILPGLGDYGDRLYGTEHS